MTGLPAPTQAQWRYELLGLLRSPQVKRVLTTDALVTLVRQVRPSAALATARAAIAGLLEAQALNKVSKGLYLNLQCRPPAQLSEAAQHIRRDSVVSLETVLGEAGFLNNPPVIVTAVIPAGEDRTPNVGAIKTSGGAVFRFHALPSRFFPRNPEEERLMLQVSRFCPTFRPEAAALHWLHLSRSTRSTVLRPPQDVDFSALDEQLLSDLAWRWELSRALAEWRQTVERLGDIQEPSDPTTVVGGSGGSGGADTVGMSEAALAARARMQARRESSKP
jgi:hypothetical protein